MKRTTKVSVICLCLVLTFLSACSYREFENSLRSKFEDEGEFNEINETIVPEAIDDEKDIESNEDGTDAEQNESETASLNYIGDTDSQYGVEYTLNDVQISGNINDVGLDRDSFFWIDRIEDNGEVKAGFKLVTVDVTIKNISAGGYDPDGEHEKPNLFVEDYIGFKDDLEDPQGPLPIEGSYFSEHPPYEQNLWNDYMQFQLGHGEELEATIGWIVPTQQLNEEPLYYLIGAVHSTSEGTRPWRYFHIVSEGEIVYPD